ncbi:MAG: biotin--[acetyl-CoA-carboxylase] ligase [Planctomycetota bacterium]
MADKLCSSTIFGSAPQRHVIGRDGEVHARVPSTMDVCRRRARDGVADGYTVLAEQQTEGRGRRADWRCEAGEGLLLSVFLGRPVPRNRRMVLSALGAVAAAEAVRGFGVEAHIKWPNDVVVDGRRGQLDLRKVGGVLVEPVSRGEAAPLHVLGMGLNVNQDADQLPRDTNLPAQSLLLERGGEPVDRNVLCRRVLARLDRYYEQMLRTDGADLLDRWRELSCLLGRTVAVESGGRRFRVRVVDIKETGELSVRTADGRRLELGDQQARVVLGA